MNSDFETRMNFMVQQQAQFWADMQALGEKLSSVAAIAETNSRQIEGNREMIRQLVDVSLSLANNIQRVDERLAQRMDELASSHAHSDRRLDALIDVVEKLARRNGGIS